MFIFKTTVEYLLSSQGVVDLLLGQASQGRLLDSQQDAGRPSPSSAACVVCKGNESQGKSRGKSPCTAVGRAVDARGQVGRK